VVVFCFSKRRCDSLVDSLASLDMTSADDKSDIQVGCAARGSGMDMAGRASSGHSLA
jgi:hypothetical protein